MKKYTAWLLAPLAWFSLALQAAPVTPEAVMAFQTLKQPVIADNGEVVAYTAMPDRGDPVGHVRRPDGQLFRLRGAEKPQLSADGLHALFERPASLLERENAGAKERKALKSGRVLIHTRTGKRTEFERVKQAEFGQAGRYLYLWLEPEEEQEGNIGSTLVRRELRSGAELRIEHVDQLVLAEQGDAVALATRTPSGENGVFLLQRSGELLPVHQEANWRAATLSLSRDGKQLAFSWGLAEQPARQREHKVGHWQDDKLRWQELNHADFMVSAFSTLQFSRDGQRLFIGRQARQPEIKAPEDYTQDSLTNRAQLEAHADLVLWHGDDAHIKPQEQKRYDDEFKRVYQGVWHLDGERFIQLADPVVPDLELADNARYLLASSDVLYRKMITWAGFYRDWYLVDLRNGQRRRLVVQTLSEDKPTLSPHDDAVVWHVRGELFWHDVRANSTRSIANGFANEDHDYPSPAPGYGFGPWLDAGEGVLLYDKYDIWRAKAGKIEALTLGRRDRIIHRVVETDPDALWAPMGQDLLVHTIDERQRNEGLHRMQVITATLVPWRQSDARLRFVAKASNSEAALFTQERYDLYPDLQLSQGWRGEWQQASDLGKQLDNLDWGQSRMVNWRSQTGQNLQGVVITPPGWDGRTPLPTIVYFYRFMSDRLHQFPQMALNHRPNFPWFASEGYAIFLPDIRFEIGHPGRSTGQAILPGVERLVELGITDPNAVGLQGHSWAGYQSAHLVTQSNAFKAVVTGAPVSNMTSAYTGIRLGSGLARQFQYEAGQSRIGQSLYRAPELYIENSPIFHADKVQTPMVIMFGDEDDAVPYEQGIELYLAMRRLGKPVVMLQYQGEPHHLKRYPNKVDYSLKMMDFFNHTLKGEAAPEWWLHGQPYKQPDPESE
ncbi:alpha/beta hydrolase family protein [Ferrimonas marina]|uniref:Dipeptidyl aminopeptidase/acylaminoacyl peptidase n=1 Tax=Ferrimonas marina TaxID=299255 RepID=A0A1M5SB18_9GAMM|nr:prolyl oligopeptidase family serine peptidase [Ferrimonas marina]SHH35832.1 Dipeptidyl aminopeptidase/acylaminoacyl peptidase [Ferrimonas marina]